MRPLAYVLLAALALSVNGCATLLAADFQPTVDEARITTGLTLKQLEKILGEDGVEITGAPGAFEFLYEHTEAWDGRRWVYFPLDFASIGTASLVLLSHVEYAIHRAAKRRAVGIFDAEGGLVLFREGEGRVRVGEPETAPKVSRTTTLVEICRMVSDEWCRS